MISVVIPLLVFLVGTIGMRYALRGLAKWERKLLWISYVAHLLGVFAGDLIATYYYGGGDRFMYHNVGGVISAHLHTDFYDIAPRLLELLFQQGGEELVPFGALTATGSMQATAAILHYLFGGTLIGSCAVVGLLGYFSKLTIYRVFRAELQKRHWRAALIATMLVPSVLYWSTGLLKEAVAIIFLGLLVSGGHMLTTRRTVKGILLLAVGAVGISLYKPYLLIAFSFAAAVWTYVRVARLRGHSGILTKPTHLVGAALGVFGVLVIISAIFPRYDYRNIQAQLLEEQQRGAWQTDAGSHYQIGSAESQSTLRQLVTTPWAIFTALFRPMIVEARSPLAFVNGLETLVLTIMLYLVLVRRGVRRCIQDIRQSRLLSFCFVFTVLLAIGVGFTSSNMGTLSRYRMPLIPFFVVIMAVLNSRPKKSTTNN